MPDVRIPTQKRSIDKKNTIIQKAFDIMCNKGYFSTTVSDIAKYSGVSVGIIYQYFNDKKEIFLTGVKNYSENIIFPIITILEKKDITKGNLNEIVSNVIDEYIKAHNISKKAHEELMAMSHLDPDVSEILKKSEINVTNIVVDLFEKNNITIQNLKEKVHIIIGIIDNLCHETVYHKHNNFDYLKMKEIVVDAIVNILK